MERSENMEEEFEFDLIEESFKVHRTVLKDEIASLEAELEIKRNKLLTIDRYLNRSLARSLAQDASDFMGKNKAIANAITLNGRFAHLNEIKRMESVSQYSKDEISSALTNMRRGGILVNYKTDKTNNRIVWGLPDWLDSEGIRKEFMYSKDTFNER